MALAARPRVAIACTSHVHPLARASLSSTRAHSSPRRTPQHVLSCTDGSPNTARGPLPLSGGPKRRRSGGGGLSLVFPENAEGVEPKGACTSTRCLR